MARSGTIQPLDCRPDAQPLHHHTIAQKSTKHHTKHSPYIPKSQHSVSQSSSCIVPSTVVPTE